MTATVSRGVRRLTPENVVAILTTSFLVPTRQLAEQFGVSYQTIADVRCGRLHAKVAPHLPRQERSCRVSCVSCIHHRTVPQPSGAERARGQVSYVAKGHACTLGVPELQIEGVRFASFCSAYVAEPVE